MMPLYFSHSTAALFWLFARGPLVRATSSPWTDGNARAADSFAMDTLRDCLNEQGVPLEYLGKIEALTTKKTRNKGNELAYRLVKNPLPRGSFCRVGNGLYVASPELAFLQMAQVLPFPRLLEFGCALTGVFRYSTSERGIADRKPVTSVKKLAHYLANVQDQRGRRAALRAIRYLLDKGASPAETQLALFLTLPFNYGGYAIPTPQLNRRIDIVGRNASLKSKRYYVADQCWPEHKLIIEYDSTLEHTGARIGEDAKKRLALQEDGYLVISVTASQLYSYAEMDKIAHVVRRRLGLYGKPRVGGFEDRKALLRRMLLVDSPLPDLVGSFAY